MGGPYRLASREERPGRGDDPTATRAGSIALATILLAWFALGDDVPTGKEVVIGIFFAAVVLLVGWCAGDRLRRGRS